MEQAEDIDQQAGVITTVEGLSPMKVFATNQRPARNQKVQDLKNLRNQTMITAVTKAALPNMSRTREIKKDELTVFNYTVEYKRSDEQEEGINTSH